VRTGRSSRASVLALQGPRRQAHVFVLPGSGRDVRQRPPGTRWRRVGAAFTGSATTVPAGGRCRRPWCDRESPRSAWTASSRRGRSRAAVRPLSVWPAHNIIPTGGPGGAGAFGTFAPYERLAASRRPTSARGSSTCVVAFNVGPLTLAGWACGPPATRPRATRSRRSATSSPRH